MRRTVVIVGLLAALVLAGSVELLGVQRAPACRVKGDPLIFGAASFLVPGLGQFMTGQDGKGLLHLAVAIALPTVAGFLIATLSPPLPIAFLVPSALYLGWSVLSAMDAYEVASTHCKS